MSIEMWSFLLVCLSLWFGMYVSGRQSTFKTRELVAWIALPFTLFFGMFVAHLELNTFEKLVAWATAGFSSGLALRLVTPRGSGKLRRKWKKQREAERRADRELIQRDKEAREGKGASKRKHDSAVRLPSTFDFDQLKETCQREEFVRCSFKHRLHWRTRGLLKNDTSVSNLKLALRKLSAVLTDWNQMKSLLGICVFLGTALGGGAWLMGLPVPWWLLMPVATVFIFTMACAAHMYSNLNQPAPQDVDLNLETGLIVWKSSSGTNRRPLSDIQQFSVRLNGIPANPDGAALFAEFPDDFSLAILETPHDLKPDYALAQLIPFARVLAETLGVPVLHEQFGRDHVADSYVKPWIPQTVLQPRIVVSVIAVITSYYARLLWPLLR